MSTLGAIVTAVGGIAALLLHLYTTKWSDQAKWRRKDKELEDAYFQAEQAHLDATVGSDNAAVARAERQWLRAAEALARHRGTGQQGRVPW